MPHGGLKNIRGLKSTVVDFERGCGQLSMSEILIQQWLSGSDDLYLPQIPLTQTLNIRKFPFVDVIK